MQILYKYIEQKGYLQDLAPLLIPLTKQKTAVTQLAKQGLKELEEVTVLLHKLGVKLQVICAAVLLKEAVMCVFSPPFNTEVCSPQVVVNLGLVYKVQHHSGVIFQFVAFIRKRKRIVPDIVAAGGRYDHLVGFIDTHPHPTCDLSQVMAQICSYYCKNMAIMCASHFFFI